MKLEKFKRIIAALGCALILTCGLAIFADAQQTDSNDKLTAEIERVVRQMNDAFTRRDEAGFNSVIADSGFLYDQYGYIAVTDFKKEIAGYFKSTPNPNKKFSYELSNFKVVSVADDTAIANYEIAQRTEEGGKTTVTRERRTDVFIRRDNRWQVFAEHSSKLPKIIEPVTAGMPTGWRRTPLTGSGAGASYALTVDTLVRHGGKASANIKSMCADNGSDWTSLAQSVAADEYRGKRVRLTGWLKTEAANKAGLWMRVDGKRRQLGFDNMDDRAVTGTTEWKQYSVVLDVPAEAVNLYFGTLVQGAGSVWADDFKIETVGAETPSTNKMTTEEMKRECECESTQDSKKVVNLDFEMGAVPAAKQ